MTHDGASVVFWSNFDAAWTVGIWISINCSSVRSVKSTPLRVGLTGGSSGRAENVDNATRTHVTCRRHVLIGVPITRMKSRKNEHKQRHFAPRFAPGNLASCPGFDQSPPTQSTSVILSGDAVTLPLMSRARSTD